jgi:hypothetical protein
MRWRCESPARVFTIAPIATFACTRAWGSASSSKAMIWRSVALISGFASTGSLAVRPGLTF